MVGGCWTGTIVGSTVTGTSLNGYTITASGIDENGNPITGYVLGKGSVEILDADTKLAPTDPIFYIHVLNAKPDNPNKGDAYVDGGVWYFYNGESWVTLGGTYAGNGWAQYPESEGGDGKWHRLVISDGKIAYEEDGVDEPTSDPFALKFDLDAEVDRSTQAEDALQDQIDSITMELEDVATKSELSDETEARTTADEALQNNIDSLSTSVNTRITQEINRATGVEEILSGDLGVAKVEISAEVQRANGAESFLSGKIDDINSELEGVATKSELSAETEARKTADTALQNQITTISSDYLKSTDKTEIEDNITSEENRAKGVENSLSSAINTKANDSAVVKLTGNQEVRGHKSFMTAMDAVSVGRNNADSFLYLHGGTSVADGSTITLAGMGYTGTALPVGGLQLAARDGKSKETEGETNDTYCNLVISPQGNIKTVGGGPDYNPQIYGIQFAMAGMPSTTVLDLTLPESGSFVEFSSGVDVAPWSGWITITKETTNTGQYLLTSVYPKDNTKILLHGYSETTVAGRYVRVSVPIAKGQRCYIYYNAGGQSIMCRFSKAEAEVVK